MSEYPEHEKMKTVQENSQIIGEFLEWLSSKNLSLCKWQDGVTGEGYYAYHFSIEELLAEFFNIDLKKVEEEKKSMLESIRRSSE